MSHILIDSLHPHYLHMRTPKNVQHSNYHIGNDSLSEIFRRISFNTGFQQDSLVKWFNFNMTKYATSFDYQKQDDVQNWDSIEQNRKLRLEYPTHSEIVVKDSIRYRFSYGLGFNKNGFIFNNVKYEAISDMYISIEDLKIGEINNDLGSVDIYIAIPNSIAKPSKEKWLLLY